MEILHIRLFFQFLIVFILLVLFHYRLRSAAKLCSAHMVPLRTHSSWMEISSQTTASKGKSRNVCCTVQEDFHLRSWQMTFNVTTLQLLIKKSSPMINGLEQSLCSPDRSTSTATTTQLIVVKCSTEVFSWSRHWGKLRLKSAEDSGPPHTSSIHCQCETVPGERLVKGTGWMTGCCQWAI